MGDIHICYEYFLALKKETANINIFQVSLLGHRSRLKLALRLARG